MYNHLILVSKEHMIGSEIANLIYTEVRVRASKQDSTYIQSKDYEPLVERELNDKQIENFKANMHLYTKVQENEHGTIYQHGTDFKKMYWELFPKEIEPVKEAPKEVFEDKKPERTHKVCSKCKKELPVADFYLRKNKQLFSKCKKCVLNDSKSKYNKLSLQKSI